MITKLMVCSTESFIFCNEMVSLKILYLITTYRNIRKKRNFISSNVLKLAWNVVFKCHVYTNDLYIVCQCLFSIQNERITITKWLVQYNNCLFLTWRLHCITKLVTYTLSNYFLQKTTNDLVLQNIITNFFDSDTLAFQNCFCSKLSTQTSITQTSILHASLLKSMNQSCLPQESKTCSAV